MIEIVESLALLAFVIAYPIVSAVTWPAFVRAARSGAPGVRVRAYVELLVVQWSLVLVLLASWALAERPWDRLGLGVPGRAAWIGLVVVALLALASLVMVRTLAASNEHARALVQGQLGDVIELLPHDRREHRWFRAVAVTAGFCEEVTYRGVLPLFLAAWLPAPWAIVAATLAFGLGHAYQGARSIPKVTMVGAALALVTWLTDSLWTAIALHAVIDLHGGAVGYAVCRRRE